MDTMQIFYAVLTLVIAGSSYVIVKANREFGEDAVQNALKYVRIGVYAVEQIAILQGWDGERKKEEVQEYLKSKNLSVSDAELDLMIEAVVTELKKLGNGVV